MLGDATRIALVAEELSDHPDEGALRVLDRLGGYLSRRFELRAFHGRGVAPGGFTAEKLPFTRLGVSRPLAAALRRFRPQFVLYVPSASVTANALWRARRLRGVTGVPVAVFGLQRRAYSWVDRAKLRFLEPDAVVTVGGAMTAPFARRGWKTVRMRLGVDVERFRPVGSMERDRQRERFGWPVDRRVVLHVGHLRRRRGLDLLARLAAHEGNHVVMVASVSETGEEELAREVASAGIELHHEYIGDIERYYQAADAYVFPVRHRTSAIEFPLSVLEALACGTPVLATPYGALPEHFDGTGALRFLAEGEDPAPALDELLARGADARALAEPFAWDAVFDELVDDLQDLLR